MLIPLVHSILPDDDPVTPPNPEPGAKAEASRRKSPKMSVESAWAEWQGNVASSGKEFLHSVASWTEGTAAQLLRQRWPTGAKRPTSAEVRERLRHNLGVAARGAQSTSMEALEKARGRVIDELAKARLAAAAPEGAAPAPRRAAAKPPRP